MKKKLLCIALLSASFLTACGNSNQENQVVETEYIDLDKLEGNDTLTDADRQRKYLLYLETYIKYDLLKPLSEVKDASVTLHSPTDSENIINSGEEISVSVVLELQDELSTDRTAELADFLATAVGNTSTDEITIMDADGNLLFPEE